jgi:hypothetical protein
MLFQKTIEIDIFSLPDDLRIFPQRLFFLMQETAYSIILTFGSGTATVQHTIVQTRIHTSHFPNPQTPWSKLRIIVSHPRPSVIVKETGCYQELPIWTISWCGFRFLHRRQNQHPPSDLPHLCPEKGFKQCSEKHWKSLMMIVTMMISTSILDPLTSDKFPLSCLRAKDFRASCLYVSHMSSAHTSQNARACALL